MTGFSKCFPRWLSVKFLDDFKPNPCQVKLAAAIAAYLSASEFRFELPGALDYGILHPMCNLHMPLYRRVIQFEKRFPGELAGCATLRKLWNLRAAIDGMRRLGKDMISAWIEGVETEVLVGGVIFPGMHCYLDDISVRKGQVSLLFAVCEYDGVGGKEVWEEFTTNEFAAKTIDPIELAFVKAWVRKKKGMRTVQIEESYPKPPPKPIPRIVSAPFPKPSSETSSSPGPNQPSPSPEPTPEPVPIDESDPKPDSPPEIDHGISGIGAVVVDAVMIGVEKARKELGNLYELFF